jgi:hypothetical protein
MQGAIMKHTLFTFSLIACICSGMADTIGVNTIDLNANVPSRPIGQTIAGVVLCASSIPMLVIGAISWGTSQSSPNYQSGNYGLGRFLGVAGCIEAASGITFLVRANMKWRIWRQWEMSHNGNLSLYTGLTVTREF